MFLIEYFCADEWGVALVDEIRKVTAKDKKEKEYKRRMETRFKSMDDKIHVRSSKTRNATFICQQVKNILPS